MFVAIFFPIYGLTLRYYIGYILQRVFDIIGYYCLIGGGFLLLLCIIGLFVGRRITYHYFILAIVLLWIGGWCTGQVIELFGIAINESTTSHGTPGYH